MRKSENQKLKEKISHLEAVLVDTEKALASRDQEIHDMKSSDFTLKQVENAVTAERGMFIKDLLEIVRWNANPETAKFPFQNTMNPSLGGAGAFGPGSIRPL